MFSTAILVAATAFGMVSAQSGLNYSTSGNISIVPDSVPLTLRQSWCTSQNTVCSAICGGEAYPNSCNPNNLTYACTCTNGPTPNVSDYSVSLPSYICNQWKIDCTANHPNDLDGQAQCHSVMCGSKNATASSTSSGSSGSSSASSSTPGATGSTSGSNDGTSPSSTTPSATSTPSHGAAAMALNLGSAYGTSIVGAGLLAAFGLML